MTDQAATVAAMLAETPDNLRVWLWTMRETRPATYRKLFARFTPVQGDALSDDQLSVNLAASGNGTYCIKRRPFRNSGKPHGKR